MILVVSYMDSINNINKPNSYRLTGKCIQGYKLVALEVTGSNGVKKLFKIDDVYKLVEMNLIYGCKIIDNNGKKHLLSTGTKIAELPLVSIDNLTEMRITGRVYQGGTLIGYTVIDGNGKVLNLSKDKVWELSRSGNISNARAYISNNKKVITGHGEYLRDLPIIRI